MARWSGDGPAPRVCHSSVGFLADSADRWGPIYLAAGVTTACLLAAIVESNAPDAVTPNQAIQPRRRAPMVRRFHEAGFEQIKVYNELRPELVPVIADEANRPGMTVTGTLPRA